MDWFKRTLQDFLQTLTPAGMKQFLRSHRWSLALSVVVTLIAVWLFIQTSIVKTRTPWLQVLEDYEAQSLDARFGIRGKRPVDKRIVIVAVDQKTLNSLGFPFPRFHYAKMLERLCGDGARSIGFDISYAFPDRSSPSNVLKTLQQQVKVDEATMARMLEAADKVDSDQAFAAAMKTCGNVTLGHFFEESEIKLEGLDEKRIEEYNYVLSDHIYPQVRKIESEGRYRFVLNHPNDPGKQLDMKTVQPNLKMFAEAAKYAGFFNFFADSDGTYRHAPFIVRYPQKVKTQLQEDFYPSLAVQTVREYLKAPGEETILWFNANGPDHLQMGQTKIRTDSSGQVLVNFGGRQETYPHYSFSDIVTGQVKAGEFKDKIVFIGATAVGIGDIRPTPFQKQGYPGVEIHANVADNILHDNFLKRGTAEESIDLVIVLFCGIVMGLVFVVMRPSLSWAAFLGSLLLVAAFVYFQFSWNGRWLSLVIPAGTLTANFVGITAYRVIFEEKEKRRTRSAFGMYVHPGLINQMLRDPGLLRLGGEEAELTVMFSDVRGFTSISEKLTPTQLVDLLNEYLTVMSDTIMRTWGTVDKYEGDAIMAFWGRPYPQPDHALRACEACLNMIEELKFLNSKWKSEGKQELNIGIGLNSGPMVVGNMGSLKRFNYTVMGDAVNLGARLEGQNKEYGTHIIISEGTYAYARDKFICRELDLIRVKGKMKPVAIYELMAKAEDAAKFEPLAKVFRQGLKLYRLGQFDEALQVFEDILAAYPNDGPAKLFASRARAYVQTPPVGVWDGVFTATSK